MIGAGKRTQVVFCCVSFNHEPLSLQSTSVFVVSQLVASALSSMWLHYRRQTCMAWPLVSLCCLLS